MEREELGTGSSAYTRGQVLNAAAVATAAKPSQANSAAVAPSHCVSGAQK